MGSVWSTFVRVGRWALLAYIIAAGMIEFAFVRNHTRGAPLAVVTGMLVVFALDVPFIIATTVARYDGLTRWAQPRARSCRASSSGMTGLKYSSQATSAAAMKRATPALRHGDTISMLNQASGHSWPSVGRWLSHIM